MDLMHIHTKRLCRRFFILFLTGLLIFIPLPVFAKDRSDTQESISVQKYPDQYPVYVEFADQILETIIDDTMDDYEKCSAVYDYIHHIPYINKVYSDDWMENGYQMLLQRSGDCFGYYSASRLLLERLGYQVIEVQNCNCFTHIWCLVSTDQGKTWKHFDPTCWSWGYDGYLCMVTDEELESYAQRHYVGYGTVSHDWDRLQLSIAKKTYSDIQQPEYQILFPSERSAASSGH